jgi:hydroxymethylbilane synthase
MTETIRLATRGSELARRQAAQVAERLSTRKREVELVEVETEGDRVTDELIHRLGRTGAFVRALDERVLEGECDAAVHSMKDMPTDQPGDLVLAGVPERAPAGDVLVTPDGASLDELPAGAVVGTSSLRRTAELLAERPDLTVEPVRGNVDTRVEKLLAPPLQDEHERRLEAEKEDGGSSFAGTIDDWFNRLTEIERRALERQVEEEYDAIVLAEAGLARIGLLDSLAYERLPTARFVPAPGQGAIAVTARDDEVSEAIQSAIDTPRTRVETTVERLVLAELGGGCIAPIGVHAVVQGEYVHTTARVLAADGSEEVSASRDLSVERYAKGAREFAQSLADRGAADLIAAAREDADE